MESGNDAKQVDKRKASDSTDTSQNSPSQTPLKRPRIELLRVAEPMQSVRDGNGNVNKGNLEGENASAVPSIPSLLEEKNKQSPMNSTVKETENSINDNFFTEIKKREEMHRSNENSNSQEDDSQEAEEIRLPAPRKRGRPSNRASVESQEEVSANRPLTITMKIYDDRLQRIVVEHLTLQTDSDRLQIFLKQYGHDLSHLYTSGYSADISSQESSEKHGRISWNSLGSTIPRESIVSISSGTSANLMKPPVAAASGRGGRTRAPNDRDPIAASTKVGDAMEVNDSASSSLNSLSNGNGHSSNGKSPKDAARGKPGGKQTPTPKAPSTSQSSDEQPVKRGRGRPPKSAKKNETPASSKSPAAGRLRSTPGNSSTDMSSDKSMEETAPSPKTPAAPRGRPPKAKTKLNLSAVENSPAGGKQIVTRENSVPGTSASAGKTVSFEVDLLSEEELKVLVKSNTLWGTIGVGEPVYARWRDKMYYSGVVTAKGHNDTWHIAFEDQMNDVASETHIVPVRIIGPGICGIYSPDGVYSPHKAVVVGQKFLEWSDDADVVGQAQRVIYAIQCDEFERPIWCTRRQLVINENDAKELRKEFSPNALVAKAADINYENIVEGPRVRRSGASASTPGTKVVGGAFDASSADERMLNPTTTPTPGRRFASKSIPEDGDESPPATATSRLGGRVPSTSTPTTSQDTPTPDPATKPAPKRPGRPRKQMFDGLQFFLTASGGGDPAQDDAVVIPYDKNELKDSIERNGGKVVDSVSKEKGTTNIFLISDSHARTVKYIYCLAAGIPCVSYEWIRKCVERSLLLDWVPFRLKSGWSLEQESVIERHTQKPLKGMKIYVTAESDELYNYWKPVLTAAQAILLRPNKKASSIPPEAEVLVTDATCATNLLSTASKNLIPIVKPEWLVQTIVTGTKADFFGHEKYRVPNGELENADEENDPPE